MCFLNDGDETFLAHVTPKARKPHVCGECGRAIAVGTVYDRVSWAFEGSAHSLASCPRCRRIRTLIFEREIAEGCADWEARAPYGESVLAQYLLDRDLGYDDATDALVGIGAGA